MSTLVNRSWYWPVGGAVYRVLVTAQDVSQGTVTGLVDGSRRTDIPAQDLYAVEEAAKLKASWQIAFQ